MRVLHLSCLVFFILIINVFGQESNLRVGSSLRNLQSGGAYFDFSDPNGVNMKISIWGYAKIPGRYIIPTNTSLMEAISYAGGPHDDALLEDVRIIRMKSDSTQEIIKFDYNQLLHEQSISKTIRDTKLQPGDTILLPGEPRFYFKDYMNIAVSIVSTLISLTILIITLARK